MRIELEKPEEKEKKDTALESDATIYSDRKENLKLKDLHGQEKWSYFKSYYLTKLILAIAAVGVVVYILISVFSPKPEDILSVAVGDNPLTQELIAQIETDINDLLVTDSDKQRVLIDTTYSLDTTNGVYSLMKITTLLSAGDLDVMILPDATFYQQLNGGSIIPLRRVFSEDELEPLKDYLVNCIPYDEDMNTGERTYYDADDYGIRFNPYLVKNGYVEANIPCEYIMCLAVNSEHYDNAKKFINYICK